MTNEKTIRERTGATEDASVSVSASDQLSHAERVRDGWRGLAAWMRAPGTINREDAIDECARAVENYAEYQFQLANSVEPASERPLVDVCKRCGRAKDSIWHYFTEQPGPDDLGAHKFEFSHRVPEWREAKIGSGTEAAKEQALSTRRSAAPSSSLKHAQEP